MQLFETSQIVFL